MLSTPFARCSLFFICLVASIAAACTWTPAYAHDLKESNGMYAILHTEPDDAPPTQQPTQLVFYLGSNKPGVVLDLTHYVVRVSLHSSNTKTVYYPVNPHNGSNSIGQATVIFPKPGKYTVMLSVSTKAATPEDFSLSYDVEAHQAPGQPSHATTTTRQAALVVLLLVGVALALIILARSRHQA